MDKKQRENPKNNQQNNREAGSVKKEEDNFSAYLRKARGEHDKSEHLIDITVGDKAEVPGVEGEQNAKKHDVEGDERNKPPILKKEGEQTPATVEEEDVEPVEGKQEAKRLKKGVKGCHAGCLAVVLSALLLTGGIIHLFVNRTLKGQNYSRSKYMDQLAECEGNLRVTGVALHNYAADNDGLFPTSIDALAPKYIERIPQCPSAKSAEVYKRSYTFNNEKGVFTLYCSGHHHQGMRLPPNYPQFCSKRGLIENER